MYFSVFYHYYDYWVQHLNGKKTLNALKCCLNGQEILSYLLFFLQYMYVYNIGLHFVNFVDNFNVFQI